MGEKNEEEIRFVENDVWPTQQTEKYRGTASCNQRSENVALK